MKQPVDCALEYRSKYSLSVFPIKKDKVPYVSWEQFQKRHPSEKEIKSWWEKWPDAGIGVVTGKISNLYTLDADKPTAKPLIEEYLPENYMLPVSTTPRPGVHWYFSGDGSEHRCGANREVGIDFKGDGGYVVLPPSLTIGQREDGTTYEGTHIWMPGFSPDDVAPPPLPPSLLSFLNIYIYSIYKGDDFKDFKNTGKDFKDFKKDEKTSKNFFVQGSRDQDLFHAANCLIKGGAEDQFVRKALELLSLSCDPPFSLSDANTKVDSALKRVKRKEGSVMDDVRAWVKTSKGSFLTSDCFKELQTLQRKEVYQALCRMEGKEIERVGDTRNKWRVRDTDLEVMNLLDASTDEFPVDLPLGISNHVKLYPSNIGVVAGSKSAGKTAYLLNLALANLNKYEVIYLNSEMGEAEFRVRLEKFEGNPFRQAIINKRFIPVYRTRDWWDVITPERKLFLIDYLEPPSEKVFIVGDWIKAINDKLKEGLCFIGLQKKFGADLARGQEFSIERSRLYISLDHDSSKKPYQNTVKIIDAKAWRGDSSPKGLSCGYKLINAHKYIQGEWA